MSNLTRRHSFAVLSGLFGAALFGKEANAQYGQSAGNDAQIVTTGNVHLGQDVAAVQSVIVRDGNGNIVRGAGQVVSNNGQIVSTGDVWLDQSASASQDIFQGSTVDNVPGVCRPGAVEANPATGELFYCDSSACWVPVPACRKGCR